MWKQVLKEVALDTAAASIWAGFKIGEGVCIGAKKVKEYAPVVKQAVSKGTTEAIRASMNGYQYLKNQGLPQARQDIDNIRQYLQEKLAMQKEMSFRKSQVYICPACRGKMLFDGKEYKCQKCGMIMQFMKEEC